MIREAVESDIPELVEMARAFHGMAPHGEIADFDAETMARTMAFLIGSETAVLLRSDDGMIGGVLVPAYFNGMVLILDELFWWAHAGGVQLRNAFEAWGRDRGAKSVVMSTLVDGRMRATARLMQMGGYRPIEVRHVKELG